MEGPMSENPNQWPPNYDELDLANAEYDVRTRQKHQRRAKPAVKLINHLLARKGFAQQETANEFQSAWNEIVEPKMQKYTSVGALKRGVLEVVVANSSVSQHLQFQKEFLEKMGWFYIRLSFSSFFSFCLFYDIDKCDRFLLFLMKGQIAKINGKLCLLSFVYQFDKKLGLI